MHKKMKHALFILFFYPLLHADDAVESRIVEQPIITVWVHGSRLLSIIKEKHESPPGMKLAKKLPHRYRLKAVAHLLSSVAPEEFPLDDFYTFGWNGKVDPKARRAASSTLYQELKKLIQHYEETGIIPKLKIITHSHGGNVALYLSEIVQEFNDSVFHVDELILLACPVQKATEAYIQSPIFKKIYSIYSNKDFLQIADPQVVQSGPVKWVLGAKPVKKLIFSERLFPPQPNLIQAQILFSQAWLSAPTHIDFLIDDAFILQLPDVLEQMKTSGNTKEQLVIKIS